ncbi:MAG: hypothetical protein PHU53_07275 [Thermoplasmata archaeon]|nr:hypothetical protein [Thermoplasmata archaeon]
MATISNFDMVHVGSGYNANISVQPIQGHERDGIMVGFYNCNEAGSMMQIRKKGDYYQLFLSQYDDLKIPEYWQDAEIVWQGLFF